MSNESLIETAKSKLELVKAHAPEVLKTGADTLIAAREVVRGARDDLKRTLKEGAGKIGQQLQNIATPNRKEAAEAKKEEVKAKKRAKRASPGAKASAGAKAPNGAKASAGDKAPAEDKASAGQKSSAGQKASVGAAHGRDAHSKTLQ